MVQSSTYNSPSQDFWANFGVNSQIWLKLAKFGLTHQNGNSWLDELCVPDCSLFYKSSHTVLLTSRHCHSSIPLFPRFFRIAFIFVKLKKKRYSRFSCIITSVYIDVIISTKKQQQHQKIISDNFWVYIFLPNIFVRIGRR